MRLALRAALPARADLAALFAGAWAGLGAAELAARSVTVGGESLVAGELFDVTGSADGTARLEGDLRLADRVGRELAEGTLVVDGPLGHEAGAGMTGGRLEVIGSVGDAAGTGMAGGTLVVRGRAGHRAGAALPGRKKGMTGGELVVFGDVGDEAGAQMRRGLLAVGGSTGAAPGFAMLAGTLVVLGACGTDPGLLSKRGSIVALGPVTPPPTYRHACTAPFAVLRLVLLRLRDRAGLPVRPEQVAGTYRRYSGDFAESGKGEILAWVAP